jgi:general secretion pathway protein G
MIRRPNHTRSRLKQSRTAQDGFTLIELIVVITIILILATIAAGQYQKTVLRARETKLRSELQVMRKAIQDYTTDKECGPSSLQDLVSNNYLSRIPEDPMTGTADWVTTSDDVGYKLLRSYGREVGVGPGFAVRKHRVQLLVEPRCSIRNASPARLHYPRRKRADELSFSIRNDRNCGPRRSTGVHSRRRNVGMQTALSFLPCVPLPLPASRP